MEFLLALQFLTRIPVTVHGPVDDKKVARAMAFFPLVGLLIGISTAIVHKFMAYIATVQVADLMAVVFVLTITGNLHLDGIMDTADGIFSGRQREGMLEIMKDSRVGAHGVAAGVLTLLAWFVLLTQINPGTAKSVALIIAPVLSRWSQIYGAAVYPYARSGNGKAAFTEYVGRRELFWASVTVLAVIFTVFGWQYGWPAGALQSYIVIGVIIAGTVLLSRYLAGKVGGITGDILGAMTACIELLTFFVLIVSQRF